MIRSVLEYLEQSVQTHGEKTAVTDERGGYTYTELEEYARRTGTCLLKRGLRNNQPVAVLLDKTKEALSVFWGITYAGGIYAPMDVHAPVLRLSRMMEVLQPAFVITDEAHSQLALELVCKEQVLFVSETFGHMADDAALQAVQRDRIDMDPLYIVFTSGSTGIPKGVVISHRAVIDFTEEASQAMRFSDQESFANQAPFYFDASVPDLYCTIRNSATLHIIPAEWYSFPIRVLEYIRDHEINAIFWVPSALIVAANLRALREVDISCLKKVMFCGEVMPTKQLNVWRKYLPDAVYVNYYGPSETTYASTYYIVDREFSDDEALPIGRAAANTGILILNGENQCCAAGEIGELCIRGSGLALGYYHDPEKTREAFVQNPTNPCFSETIYRTGDLVRENERGELEYICRKDSQIKHMGYRIELGEIESAVSGVRNVKRVCCLYHDKKKVIVLLYEGDTSPEEVRTAVKSRVPDYMVPGMIIRVDELPLNANGKINRVLLKEKYGKN